MTNKPFFVQRDYKGRCIECGRGHPPGRFKKRLYVLAMARVPGLDDDPYLARYRAVILPRSIRIQCLSSMAHIRTVDRNRYYWRDIQKIPREKQAPSKLHLENTLSDFERAIACGALARRVRDAASAIERDRTSRAQQRPRGIVGAIVPQVLGWWSRQFTLFPWMILNGERL